MAFLKTYFQLQLLHVTGNPSLLHRFSLVYRHILKAQSALAAKILLKSEDEWILPRNIIQFCLILKISPASVPCF